MRMKVNRKNIIFFIGGLCLGTLGGILGVKGHYKSKAKRDIDKFLDEFFKEDGTSDNPYTEGEPEYTPPTKEEIGSRAANDYIYVGPIESANMDPSECVGPSEEAGSEKIEEEIEEREESIRRLELITDDNRSTYEDLQMHSEMNSGRKPKLISEDTFYEPMSKYDKIDLEYYTGDDILVDTTNEMEVYDSERVVGDCLDKYGFRSNDEEIIYIRNFSFATDYSVTKIFASFYEDEVISDDPISRAILKGED